MKGKLRIEGSDRRETKDNKNNVIGRRTSKDEPENVGILAKEKGTSKGKANRVIAASRWLKRKTNVGKM